MYARISPYRFDPVREEQLQRLTDEQLIPAIRQLPGFRHYFGTIDRATGRGYAITVWETAEHADGLREALSDVIAEFTRAGLELEAAQTQEVVGYA